MDCDNAVFWWEKAAEQGYAPAQFKLGIAYNGGLGVSLNPEKAVEWFTKAAEQGMAEAQYQLGICYRDGNGVSRNLNNALFRLTQSAEQGYANAQYELGEYYGVVQNYEKAAEWLLKAAKQGHKEAIEKIQKLMDILNIH